MIRAIVLLALLWSTGVAAASDVTLEIDHTSQATVMGHIAASTSDGVLDLAASENARKIAMHIENAQGVRVVVHRTRNALYEDTIERTRSTLTLPSGRLEALECGTSCEIALIVAGHGVLGVDGGDRLSFEGSREARQFCGYSSCLEESYRSPEGAFVWSAVSGDAAPTAQGTVTLLLRNATAVFTDQSGKRTTLDAMTVVRDSAPFGLTQSIDFAYYWITVNVSGIDTTSPVAPILRAQHVSVTTNGTFEAQEVTGSLLIGPESQELREAHVVIQGDSTAIPEFRNAAIAELPAVWDASVAGAVHADGARVIINGKMISSPPRSATMREVDIVAVAALAIGLLILVAKLAALRLYVRINPAAVLGHPQRVRLMSLLAASERSIAELQRATGLSRGTILHHLRMLKAHGHVRKAAVGREVLYASSASSHRLCSPALVLRDQTRRRIVHHLVSEPGASQRDIVAATGLSQRLVSHHLRRLEAAKIVRASKHVPHFYELCARLEDAEFSAATDGDSSIPL